MLRAYQRDLMISYVVNTVKRLDKRDPAAGDLISPLISGFFRLSLPDEECGGESRPAALRDPPCHQHGPGGREQNENTAISARHGLPRGAGADELAHQ